MKQIFKFSPIFCVIFFFTYDIFGQQKNDYAPQIDSLIQTTTPRNFNGVILINKNGKTKYSKAFGYANLDKKVPLKMNDNFIIMSNSKQITAVLILREVEKGNIDLHIPIRKYLPNLQQTWADTVTVHNLLNFTAGITDIDKPLIFKSGNDFKYGNTNYALLGKIIENITGKPYIEVANIFFQELKMKNTFCFEPNKVQNRTEGYINNKNNFKLADNPIVNLDNIAAAGIISNAKDLSIWDRKLHKGKILNPETYLLMTNYNITAQHIAFGTEKIGYGYGIRINDKILPKYIGHTGGGNGFVSFKIYFPKNDVNIIILENQSNEEVALFYALEIKIKEIILKSKLLK